MVKAEESRINSRKSAFYSEQNVVDPVIIRWITFIYFFIYSIYCIPIINKIYNELIGE